MVPWKTHMSHTTLSFYNWAPKNMAAAYSHWSPYNTINRLLPFRNSLLAAVGTLQCVCLQSTTQHKLHAHIYIYIFIYLFIVYIMHAQYRVDLDTACPVPQQSKAVCALTLYSTLVSVCTASLTFWNTTFCTHSVFMCFVCISEKTAIISLYSINRLLFITEIEKLQPSGYYMYHHFDIQQFYILPTQFVYVFYMDLRTNSDYFPIKY
jgi:hypothetical protein